MLSNVDHLWHCILLFLKYVKKYFTEGNISAVARGSTNKAVSRGGEGRGAQTISIFYNIVSKKNTKNYQKCAFTFLTETKILALSTCYSLVIMNKSNVSRSHALSGRQSITLFAITRYTFAINIII